MSLSREMSFLKSAAKPIFPIFLFISFVAQVFVIGISPPSIFPEESVQYISATIRIYSHANNETLYYSTDGSYPSRVIGSGDPILLTGIGVATIQAFARVGESKSDIINKTYNIQDRCQQPIILPNGGTFAGYVDVTLSSATINALLCYNINSDKPPSLSSPCVENGQTIRLVESEGTNTHTMDTLTVMAFMDGYANSVASEALFTIMPKVSNPSILPLTDTFTISATLTFDCATPNATIYYSTDGSTPSTTSLTVSSGGSIVIENPGFHTIKCFATEAHRLQSDIVTKEFKILERFASPVFSPPSGVYVGNVEVKILCDDTSAVDGVVYYTTDDYHTPSTSTATHVQCGGQILLRAPGKITLRALASALTKSPSSIVEGSYTLFRPAYDEYPTAQPFFTVQPDVSIYVVEKELSATPSYCGKRDIRGRLVVLRNPLGHFDVVPPVGGCSAGELELPSVSGRAYKVPKGFNITSVVHINNSTNETHAGGMRATEFVMKSEDLKEVPAYLRASFSNESSPVTLKQLDDWRSDYSAVDGLGCQVVTNAGFFNTTSKTCIGDVVTNQEVIQTSSLHNVNFGIRNGSFVIGYINNSDITEPRHGREFDVLVSGLGWLVRDSQSYIRESFSTTYGDGESQQPQTTGSASDFANVLSARTALGFDLSGNLLLLQVEGATWVRGMTLYEFADLAVELGFMSAINLDGGGSATMTQNHSLISEPSWSCPPMTDENGQVFFVPQGSPNALPAAEAFFRCEKQVSSITCIHAMTPPFFDPLYLNSAREDISLPTSMPSVAPTVAGDRTVTSFPIIMMSSYPSSAVYPPLRGGVEDDVTTIADNFNDDQVALSPAYNATVERMLDLQESLLEYTLASYVLFGMLMVSLSAHAAMCLSGGKLLRKNYSDDSSSSLGQQQSSLGRETVDIELTRRAHEQGETFRLHSLPPVLPESDSRQNVYSQWNGDGHTDGAESSPKATIQSADEGGGTVREGISSLFKRSTNFSSRSERGGVEYSPLSLQELDHIDSLHKTESSLTWKDKLRLGTTVRQKTPPRQPSSDCEDADRHFYSEDDEDKSDEERGPSSYSRLRRMQSSKDDHITLSGQPKLKIISRDLDDEDSLRRMQTKSSSLFNVKNERSCGTIHSTSNQKSSSSHGTTSSGKKRTNRQNQDGYEPL